MLSGVIPEKNEEEENQCDTVAGETRLTREAGWANVS